MKGLARCSSVTYPKSAFSISRFISKVNSDILILSPINKKTAR